MLSPYFGVLAALSPYILYRLKLSKTIKKLYTLDGSLASFQNKRKIPSDPQERIKPITNSNPRHPDSPFYGPNPIKPLATLTLTKIKEVCGGDEGSQSIDDVAPSTEDLVNQMKKKMMLTKKLGTVNAEIFANILFSRIAPKDTFAT